MLNTLKVLTERGIIALCYHEPCKPDSNVFHLLQQNPCGRKGVTAAVLATAGRTQTILITANEHVIIADVGKKDLCKVTEYRKGITIIGT